MMTRWLASRLGGTLLATVIVLAVAPESAEAQFTQSGTWHGDGNNPTIYANATTQATTVLVTVCVKSGVSIGVTAGGINLTGSDLIAKGECRSFSASVDSDSNIRVLLPAAGSSDGTYQIGVVPMGGSIIR